ncbi:hypothetical protein [Spiroplasma ixodetis]|uniref:hypothetical protein n=1 Tax=Spiroplasma ixodetis TaxID=2141 RepID=UPI002577B7B1|nr:hypothetical protein [Spiroplasma ixodetis]
MGRSPIINSFSFISNFNCSSSSCLIKFSASNLSVSNLSFCISDLILLISNSLFNFLFHSWKNFLTFFLLFLSAQIESVLPIITLPEKINIGTNPTPLTNKPVIAAVLITAWIPVFQ